MWVTSLDQLAGWFTELQIELNWTNRWIRIFFVPLRTGTEIEPMNSELWRNGGWSNGMVKWAAQRCAGASEESNENRPKSQQKMCVEWQRINESHKGQLTWRRRPCGFESTCHTMYFLRINKSTWNQDIQTQTRISSSSSSNRIGRIESWRKE